MTALIHIHSFVAWTLLVLLLVSIVSSFSAKRKGTSFGQPYKRIFLVTMILSHIQLALGFILYFTSSKVEFSGQTMSEDLYRFFTLEHPLLMIVAVILVTIGYTRSRKAAEDRKGFNRIFVFYLIALGLILLRFPYQYLTGIGKGWFA